VKDLDRALACLTRSGEQALALLAYEQAAAHLRQAIDLVDRRGVASSPGRRCELLIALGEAERMAGDARHRETLLAAAQLAEETGDAPRLARAALANSRGLHSSTQYDRLTQLLVHAGIDCERVAAVEAALALLGDDDPATRADLLAQLAIELGADEDWRRREGVATEALTIARHMGRPATLARVLTQHGSRRGSRPPCPRAPPTCARRSSSPSTRASPCWPRTPRSSASGRRWRTAIVVAPTSCSSASRRMPRGSASRCSDGSRPS